jgi:hypothetical protein
MAQLFYYATLIFALAFVVKVIIARKMLQYWLPFSIVVYFICIYMPFFGEDRFHFPIIPILSIFAASMIVDIIRKA